MWAYARLLPQRHDATQAKTTSACFAFFNHPLSCQIIKCNKQVFYFSAIPVPLARHFMDSTNCPDYGRKAVGG
jgi:hypothetical protein